MANQTSGKDGKGRELVCSFCGRTQNEVEQLIIGPGVNICKDCLDMCNNALYKDGERPAPPRAGMPRNRRRTAAQPGADYDYDPLESINILTPAEIKAGLDQYVIGQDAAKKVLAVSVYNHYKRILSRESSDVELQKSNVLMLGPSGTGKTLLAQTLARMLNVPFAIADATTITEAGYVGEDVENILLKLIQVNTKNILFICGGAFDGLEKLIQKRTDNASLGFGSQLRATLDKDETRQKLLKKVEPDDLVKFGLIPELIGRLPVVTVLDPLDEEALVRVLTEPKNSIVRQYKELFHLDNAELVFTEDALHAIAKKTVERKSGARGLRSVVEELLIPIMYDIPSDATITKVTIDADTVAGGEPRIEHGMMRPRYKNMASQQ